MALFAFFTPPVIWGTRDKEKNSDRKYSRLSFPSRHALWHLQQQSVMSSALADVTLLFFFWPYKEVWFGRAERVEALCSTLWVLLNNYLKHPQIVRSPLLNPALYTSSLSVIFQNLTSRRFEWGWFLQGRNKCFWSTPKRWRDIEIASNATLMQGVLMQYAICLTIVLKWQ